MPDCKCIKTIGGPSDTNEICKKCGNKWIRHREGSHDWQYRDCPKCHGEAMKKCGQPIKHGTVNTKIRRFSDTKMILSNDEDASRLLVIIGQEMAQMNSISAATLSRFLNDLKRKIRADQTRKNADFVSGKCEGGCVDKDNCEKTPCSKHLRARAKELLDANN